MILRTRRLTMAWAFGACVTCGTAACSSSSATDAAPRVFTGQVNGTDARVAVVATTHNARVFFCGGASSFSGSTHWFSVAVGPTGLLASPSATGLSFTGQVKDGQVQGTFVAGDGQPHVFTAIAVKTGTIAGLYEAAGPCGQIGLIVSQDSPAAAPTGQGACIGSPGANGTTPVEQVTPLRPLTRAADGTIPVVVTGSTAPILTGPATAPAD